MDGMLHIADRNDGARGARLSLLLPLVVVPSVPNPAVLSRAVSGANGGQQRGEVLGMSPSRASAFESQHSAVSIPSALPLPGLRVLLVDDSAGNRRVGERMLTSLGCVVSLATDGDEVSAAVAAAEAASRPYHAILMDIWMVRVNGDAACIALRERGCHVPILAVTANSSTSDKALYIAHGFTGVLSKPFSKDELREALLANVVFAS